MGIIIGLVIGLSIAVVVALVINKASSPFTNKGGKTDKVEDLPVTQMQDPNKPLYGTKEAVNQAAKEVAASKAAESAKPAEVKVDVKPEVKVADAAASKADNNDDKYIYFLQIGAFKEQPDAESARAKLALIGLEASVSEKTSDTGTLYRVRVGPFDHADAMNKIRAKLSENSVDAAIVRTAK